MVPSAPPPHKLPTIAALAARWAEAWAVTLRPTGWAVLLWALVLALPWLELRGDVPALDREAIRGLVWLPPLAVAWAATTGNTQTLFGVATIGLVPALVAAPALASASSTPLRGLAVAAVLLILLASTIDRADRFAPLRRLSRWPKPWADRLLLGLAPFWLVAAWAGGASVGRLAGVAVAWVATAQLSIGAGGEIGQRQRGRALLARGLWFILVLAAWWLRPEASR